MAMDVATLQQQCLHYTREYFSIKFSNNQPNVQTRHVCLFICYVVTITETIVDRLEPNFQWRSTLC